MIKNILIVCTGNICRSPMAEALMRQKLPEMVVYSAGLHALYGAAVDRFAVDAVRKNGIDISGHRARNISAWMVKEADLVLTMDGVQKRSIEVKYPAFENKVWRVGEYGNFDIPDPHQKGHLAFQESLSLITQGIEEWTAYLLSFNRNKTGVLLHAASP